MTSLFDTIARFTRANWTSLLLMGAVLTVWLLLRMRSSEIASLEEFDRRIAAGQPVIVVLFSNT